MKKFLKILLIIVGIVFLIFAALICIGLFVDYDDHIENGRYTYVPEDDNKDNAYVEFNLSDYDKKDSELIYYSSVEEAILNSPLNAENEEFSVPEDFLNHVDEILHIWNGKQYDTIFYRAGSDNDPVQGFVMARCKKTGGGSKCTICVCKCYTSYHYTRYHLWGRLQKIYPFIFNNK